MTKSKNNERETLAINNFRKKSTVEKIFLGMDPLQLFNDIREQVAAVIEAAGLKTEDPHKLYHTDYLPNQYQWPVHIREAIEAFHHLCQAEENRQRNDANWTAYHLLHAMQHISLYNLMCFENQIVLGDKLREAQIEGGVASGLARREKSQELKRDLIAQAEKLLANGKSESELVGILKQRHPQGETFIRQTLKEAGLTARQTKN